MSCYIKNMNSKVIFILIIAYFATYYKNVAQTTEPSDEESLDEGDDQDTGSNFCLNYFLKVL